MNKHTITLSRMGETRKARADELSELERLEREIQKRKQEILEANARSTPLEDLACRLHEVMCTANHTDGCGWYYEIDRKGVHNWNDHAHARYLKKAVNLTDAAKTHNVSPETLLDIFVNVKGW